MTHLPELEARLDALITEILPPLRTSKTLDPKAVTKLYEVVDGLAAELGGDDLVPRRLTGKLWFIFTQMLDEAGHTRAPDDILRTAWGYEERLVNIFGPYFSISPPTPPGVPRY